MRMNDAIDLWLGALALTGRSPETRRAYRRTLNGLADHTYEKPPAEVTATDIRRFLARWENSSPSTMGQAVSCLRGFFDWLRTEGHIKGRPMENIHRPPRKRPEDLDVVTVAALDVERMLAACQDWQELLCLATAAYSGARRKALARARLADVDFNAGTIRFLEKGGKPITKPAPDEYLVILRAAQDHGVWASPEDYLIPNRRPASVRRRERSDKIIWETVKRVAARAGVRSHVHALRAAFAVAFDEAHPDQVLALKDLMGHRWIETTEVYLRRRDKAKAMEAVRDLSWSSGLPSFAQEAHTGFEPVLSPQAVGNTIRRKLAELTAEGVTR